jgi:hypothetical protein
MRTNQSPSTLFDSLPDDHPVLGCDDIDDGDPDELADPFVILAAREECAGVPLFFLTQEPHD